MNIARMFKALRAIVAVALFFVLGSAVFAAPVQRIVVPVRDIGRGEVVSASDFALVPAVGMTVSGVATAAIQVSGLEARRALRSGEPVRLQDFRHPVVVTKGSTVSMSYEVPGVSLNATMRAISAGGVGEMVTVQNPVSFRQVSAVVTGPGQVRAVGGAGLTLNPQPTSVSSATP